MSLIDYLISAFIPGGTPALIGRLGERFVEKELSKLDKNHYKILNNILLPSFGNSNTTQIDHLVVSNYGIFCIETKDYKGWIFGNSKQEYWTQVIYYNKNRFYNPLRQNYAHTKAIEALIKPFYTNIVIVSLVAFPKADKLKISGTDSVGYVGDVLNKIISFTAPIFSDVDRDKIFEILNNANIKDREARRLHNNEVQKIKHSHSNLI